MKWTKFKVKTITDAEDIIISTLYDIGLEGAQIEDKVPLTAWEKEQMFVDILPEGPEDDGIAYLSFFVEEEEPATENAESRLLLNGETVTTEEILERVKAELEELQSFMDIGEGTVTVEETEDLDWINNWKQYFHQFTVEDVLVIPSWEEVEPEDQDKMVLHIDPGTAFGTGMHDTTQLCIKALRKFVTPETVLLDVGTGSGILAILALMFGAKKAIGTDLDPCAIEAVRQNKEANGIPEEDFRLLIGNIITEKEVQDEVGYECYDIVAANILAEVLVGLTPVIVHQLKKGGIYITSGIIDDKEETVVEAVKAAGLEVLEVNRQGEWVSVAAKKRINKESSVFYYADGIALLREHCGNEKKCISFLYSQPRYRGNRVIITGKDVNHIKNVLRMKSGEEISVKNGCDDREYRCGIEILGEDEIICELRFIKEEGLELPSKIYLFQGLPKADKMELILQKAVELGVYEVIPVASKRAVVKLDEKKARSKIQRWQQIAEAAAKQSKRGIIPKVREVMSFQEAADYSRCAQVRLIPYELAEENGQGMEKTKDIINGLKPGEDVAIFIGPEGGFAPEEIETALRKGLIPITLGKRILRTETAGMTVLAILMYHFEQ